MADFSNFQNADFSQPQMQPSFIPPVGDGFTTDQPIQASFFDTQAFPTAETSAERGKRYDYALGDKSPGPEQLASEIQTGQETQMSAQRSYQERTDLNLRRAQLVQNALKNLPAGTVTPEDVAQIQSMDKRATDQAYADPLTFYERKFADKAVQTAAQDVNQSDDPETKPVKNIAANYTNVTTNQAIARKLFEDATDSVKDRTWLQATKTNLVPFYSWLTLSHAFDDPTEQGGFLLSTNIRAQIQAAYRLDPDKFKETQTKAIADLKEKDPELAARYASALLGYTASDEFTDNIANVLDLSVIGPGELGAAYKGTAYLAKRVGNAPQQYINNLQLIQAASRLNGMTKNLAGSTIQYTDLLPLEREAHAIALENLRIKASNTGQGAEWNDLLRIVQPIHNPQSVLEGAANMSAEEAARLEVGLLRTARNSLDNIISRPRSLERLSLEEVAAASSQAEKFVETMYAQTSRAQSLVAIKADNLAAQNTLANTDAVAKYWGTSKGGGGFATESGAKGAATKNGVTQFTTENVNGEWYYKTHHYVDEKDTTLQAFARPNEAYEDKPNRSWLGPILSYTRRRDALIPDQLSEDFKVAQAATNSYFHGNREQFISDFSGLNKESRNNMDSFLERERDYRNQTGASNDPTAVVRGRYSNNVGEFNQRWMQEYGVTPTFNETKAYFSFKTWNDVDYAVRNLDLTRDMTRIGIMDHKLRFRVPGQDGDFYTPNLEGKILLQFPWERKGDAGILVWDLNPQTENSARKLWIPDASTTPTPGKSIKESTFGNPGKLTRESIDDLINNKGYVVLHLAPHAKQRLADTMASWGGPGTDFIPPKTPITIAPKPSGLNSAGTKDAYDTFYPSSQPDKKVDTARRIINRQLGVEDKTTYNLSSLTNTKMLSTLDMSEESLSNYLNKELKAGRLTAFDEETGQQLTAIPIDRLLLETKEDASDILIKFNKTVENTASDFREENFLRQIEGKPTVGNVKALGELKAQRVKAETGYQLSSEAHMEPNPYHEFEDLTKGLTEKENSLFQAHGIQSVDPDQSLIDFLDKGIDPSREFHSGPVNPTDEQRATGMLGTKLFGSPYIILSDAGKSIKDTGIKTVVLQKATGQMKSMLGKEYPDVDFLTPKQAVGKIRRETKEYEAPTDLAEGQRQLSEASRPIVGYGEHNIGDEVYRIKAEDQAELNKTGKLKAAPAEGKITEFYHDDKFGGAAKLDNGSIVPINELYKPGSVKGNVRFEDTPLPGDASVQDAYKNFKNQAVYINNKLVAEIRYEVKGNTLEIDSINGKVVKPQKDPSALPQANTLGPKAMRGIFDQLKKENPQIETIKMLRVTGAVKKAKQNAVGLEKYTRRQTEINVGTARKTPEDIRYGEPTIPPIREVPEGPGINKGWEIPNYDYLIVKPEQDMKSANLGFVRFPYQEGGHQVAQHDWKITQPQIYTHKEAGLNPKTTINTYEGDKNAYMAEIESDARDFHTHLENVRTNLQQDLVHGTNSAEAYYNQFMDGVSGDFKKFKNQFREYAKDGHLTVQHPFLVVPRDQSSWKYLNDLRDANGKPILENLENMRDSPHNLYNNDLNLKFAMQRSDNLEQVVRKGTAQAPIFGTQPQGNMSPMSTLVNSTSQLIRGRVVDDLKLKSATSFGKMYARVIDASADQIAKDPMEYILNPKWKTDLRGDDLVVLNSAKDYRRALVDFLGIEDQSREWTMTVQRSAADFIKRRLGQGSYDWVDRHLLRSGAISPIRWANSAVFDIFQGLLNVKQLITQGVTASHSIAVLGKTGLDAGWSAWAGRLLLYNDRKDLAQYMATAVNKASLGAIKKEWFIEGLDSLKRSGWHIVGQETAMQDDFINQSIKPSFVENSREMGRVFFKEGDRYTRNTAYFGAYYEWRIANPLAKLTPRIEKQILDRADDLSLNMTAASNAAMAKGVSGIPLKYTAYYLRMMEHLMPGWGDVSNVGEAVWNRSTAPLGRKATYSPLTTGEKMRAYATYSTLFGAPITAGGVFGLWPFHKEFAKALQDRGYKTDDNTILNLFNNGLAETLPSLLGVKANISEAIGPSGSDWLYDIYNGRSPLFDIVTGVAGTKLADTYENAWPFFTFIANAFRSDERAYPLNWADLEAFLRTPSSVNNAWKAIQMYNTGVYATKNMTPLASGMTGTDSIMSLMFGTEPKSVQQAFIQSDMTKITKDMKTALQKDIQRVHRLQMKAVAEGDRDAAIQYGKEIKYNIIKGGFRPDEMNALFADAITKNRDFVNFAQKQFYNSSPDRMNLWMQKIKPETEDPSDGR